MDKEVNEVAKKKEKKKGALKAKIIAGIIFAVAIFGLGFYTGATYGIKMYQMSIRLGMTLAWMLPVAIILLIIAIVIYIKVRKVFKSDD